MPSAPDREPACLHCRHFTLRPALQFPYQCALWGLQCRGSYPSREILATTGKHCPYHTPKQTEQQAGDGGRRPDDGRGEVDLRA